jgi:hypothetical protein
MRDGILRSEAEWVPPVMTGVSMYTDHILYHTIYTYIYIICYIITHLHSLIHSLTAWKQ